MKKRLGAALLLMIYICLTAASAGAAEAVRFAAPVQLLTLPDGDRLVFWVGSNDVCVEYDGTGDAWYYKAVYADGETVAGDIAAAWLTAAQDMA